MALSFPSTCSLHYQLVCIFLSSSAGMEGELIGIVLQELPPLISDNDLHISQQVLTLLCTVMEVNPSSMSAVSCPLPPLFSLSLFSLLPFSLSSHSLSRLLCLCLSVCLSLCLCLCLWLSLPLSLSLSLSVSLCLSLSLSPSRRVSLLLKVTLCSCSFYPSPYLSSHTLLTDSAVHSSKHNVTLAFFFTPRSASWHAPACVVCLCPCMCVHVSPVFNAVLLQVMRWLPWRSSSLSWSS